MAFVSVLGLAPGHASAQELARPGWAGNGVSVEPWWKHAVFYRIDPAKFQATGTDSKGSLSAIQTRLGYIQALGVDAIIIESSEIATPVGLDDLARAAVDAHMRVLVELGAPASQSTDDDANYLALARAWLNQGAAGLYIPTAKLSRIDGAGHIANLLHSLRALTDSFPGDRVLLADTAPASDTGGQDQDLLKALAKETQLTAGLPIKTDKPDAASLRAQLERELGEQAPALSASPRKGPIRSHTSDDSNNPSGNLLLVAERAPKQPDDKQQAALDRTIGAMLLASRAAVLLDYGQELGLLEPASNAAPLMQWTPSNVTPKPEPPAPPPAPVTAPTSDTEPTYGSFTEFIPPLPLTMFPPLRRPEIIVTDEPIVRILPPELQPGFTDGDLDPTLSAPNGAAANAAMEDLDEGSVLNFYRRLIHLHHDNATLRKGAETILPHDAENALVWLRSAPAGAVTVKDVAVVCNLSPNAFTLDLAPLHLRSGTARTLLSSSPTHTGTDVPPDTVTLDEIR